MESNKLKRRGLESKENTNEFDVEPQNSDSNDAYTNIIRDLDLLKNKAADLETKRYDVAHAFLRNKGQEDQHARCEMKKDLQLSLQKKVGLQELVKKLERELEEEATKLRNLEGVEV